MEVGSTPTYDANGNMTGDETGRKFIYDAWNRLVAVTDEFDTVIKSYLYDGLNRRVTETVDAVTTQLIYSNDWQVLEERVDDEATARYVWSPVYVDAMILRDRAITTPGTFDERLYVVQDANFNVVALADVGGEVVQRYVYDPYGVATVLNEDYTTTTPFDYSWIYLHQGGRLDTVSDNYYIRNRDFSSTLGRWTSVDPIRFAGGDVNLYRGLGNNSVNYVDPTGELFWMPLIIIGGAFFVGSAGYANAPTSKDEASVGAVRSEVVMENVVIGIGIGAVVVAPTIVVKAVPIVVRAAPYVLRQCQLAILRIQQSAILARQAQQVAQAERLTVASARNLRAIREAQAQARITGDNSLVRLLMAQRRELLATQSQARQALANTNSEANVINNIITILSR